MGSHPAARPGRRIAATLVVLAALASPAAGQDTAPTFELSFSNPGARSMGFGGAFVALADDATAAFANPAGLVQLVRPEVFFELRARFSTDWSLDSSSRVVSDLTGLSYLSFVYPRGDWAIALNGHRMVSWELQPFASAALSSAPVASARQDGDPWPINEIDVVRYALSVAYRANERLAIGLGVSYFKATMELTAPLAETLGGVTTLDLARASGGGGTARDADTRLNAGLLFHPSERWRIGSFYRAGPRFTVLPGGPGTPADEPGDRLAFPDTYGVGAAYRSRNGALTLTAEWDRVEYSTFLAHWQRGEIQGGRLALDDSDEMHLGGEYAFLKASPLVAVRAGVWLEPDRQIHYEGADAALRARYPRGERRLHSALGFGLAFAKIQFDMGFDLADSINAISCSFIWSL